MLGKALPVFILVVFFFVKFCQSTAWCMAQIITFYHSYRDLYFRVIFTRKKKKSNLKWTVYTLTLNLVNLSLSFVCSRSMKLWVESLVYRMKGQWYWRGSSAIRLPADTGVDLARLHPAMTWSKCFHRYIAADSQPSACTAQEHRSAHYTHNKNTPVHRSVSLIEAPVQWDTYRVDMLQLRIAVHDNVDNLLSLRSLQVRMNVYRTVYSTAVKNQR